MKILTLLTLLTLFFSVSSAVAFDAHLFEVVEATGGKLCGPPINAIMPYKTEVEGGHKYTTVIKDVNIALSEDKKGLMLKFVPTFRLSQWIFTLDDNGEYQISYLEDQSTTMRQAHKILSTYRYSESSIKEFEFRLKAKPESELLNNYLAESGALVLASYDVFYFRDDVGTIYVYENELGEKRIVTHIRTNTGFFGMVSTSFNHWTCND